MIGGSFRPLTWIVVPVSFVSESPYLNVPGLVAFKV